MDLAPGSQAAHVVDVYVSAVGDGMYRLADDLTILDHGLTCRDVGQGDLVAERDGFRRGQVVIANDDGFTRSDRAQACGDIVVTMEADGGVRGYHNEAPKRLITSSQSPRISP